MSKTIASLEIQDVDHYIGVNDNGVLVALYIRHRDVRDNKWYKWTRRKKRLSNTGIVLRQLNVTHDEFEGLAKQLRIDPEITLSEK